MRKLIKFIANIPGARNIVISMAKVRTIPPARFLNIGCGGNPILKDGWLNIDLTPSMDVFYADVTKRLKFKDETIDIVFTEHMIEHLTKTEAEKFLKECFRVMKSGSVIRVVTPDLDNIVDCRAESLSVNAANYIKCISRLDDTIEVPEDALNNMFYKHGHKYIYNESSLVALMSKAGFSSFKKCAVGVSKYEELNRLEKHGNVIGDEANIFESLVIEARKA